MVKVEKRLAFRVEGSGEIGFGLWSCRVEGLTTSSSVFLLAACSSA